MSSELTHVGRAKAKPETIGAEETPAPVAVEAPLTNNQEAAVVVSPSLELPPSGAPKKKKKKKLPPKPEGFFDRLRSLLAPPKPRERPAQQIGGKEPADTKRGLKTLLLVVVAAKLLENK